VVAVGVLAFALLGSGGGSLTDPVAQAATVSSSSAGYRAHVTMDMSLDGLPLTATADGVIDLPDHAFSMTMAMDMSELPGAAQALGGSSTMQIGMIMEDGSIYMKLPQMLASKIPSLGSRPWLRLDLSKLSGVPDVSSLMSNPALSDPTQVLRYLRAEADSVSNEGTQIVNGFTTTHYHIDLALDRVPPNLPAADRAQFQQALSRLEQTTQLHELPADVWVDAHNLIRRVVLTLDVHAAGGPAIQSIVTEDLSDYGPQPRPTPPPADQVQDLTGQIGAGGGVTTGG
jgi:hypothetical protein